MNSDIYQRLDLAMLTNFTAYAETFIGSTSVAQFLWFKSPTKYAATNDVTVLITPVGCNFVGLPQNKMVGPLTVLHVQHLYLHGNVCFNHYKGLPVIL